MAARAHLPAKVLLASLLGKKQGIITGVLTYLPFLQIYSKNDLKNIVSVVCNGSSFSKKAIYCLISKTLVFHLPHDCVALLGDFLYPEPHLITGWKRLYKSLFQWDIV